MNAQMAFHSTAMNLRTYAVSTVSDVEKLTNSQIALVSESAGGLGHPPMIKVAGGYTLVCATGTINILTSGDNLYIRAGKGSQVDAETHLHELIGSEVGSALTYDSACTLVRLWRRGRMDNCSSICKALSGEPVMPINDWTAADQEWATT